MEKSNKQVDKKDRAFHKIVKQKDGRYSIFCYYTDENEPWEAKDVYSMTNLGILDVVQFMQGRGNEDADDHIVAALTETNAPYIFVDVLGVVNAYTHLN